MAEFKLRIEGMHCGACVRRVTQALAATEGIVVEEVHVGGAKVTSTGPIEPALAAVGKAGFTAELEP